LQNVSSPKSGTPSSIIQSLVRKSHPAPYPKLAGIITPGDALKLALYHPVSSNNASVIEVIDCSQGIFLDTIVSSAKYLELQ
jgi:hypothetical protein